MKTHTIVTLLAAAGLGLALVSTADAKLARQGAAQPAAEKAASPSDQAVPAEKIVVVESASDGCCQDRCIKYRHHGTLRKTCCGCETPVKVILAVQDPCCCKCVVEIPICLPGCCEGTPTVCDRNGLLGRNVVTYQWCCGYKVRVVFDRCGDIVVHSYGR